jgi:hypothetical protein
MPVDLRSRIQHALANCATKPLVAAGRELFATLGYSSDRRIEITPNTAAEFISQFGVLNEERALTSEWRSVDFLLQLTDGEIGNRLAFSTSQVDNTVIESYVVLAIELTGPQYTRTRLATIAREVNRRFPMPVMILFRHVDAISLAVIDRELNRRDSSRDVLRKVTLIKDIRVLEPARAHVEILNDLSLESLYEEYKFHNFVELHRAWAKKLDSTDLNKRFFQDVANWYFWAKKHSGVRLPKDIDGSSDEGPSIFFIRLLTRLIFCWFLQEKGLIPRRVFQWSQLQEMLKSTKPEAGTYYQAILQNLFFATLNRETDKRRFRPKKTTGFYDKSRGVTNLYRYEDLVNHPDDLLRLFSEVPFVNGGLFDCLDDVYKQAENQPTIRLDGFSDDPRERANLPNDLFFGVEQRVNLSADYNDQRKADVLVRPLIETLSRYKFTVEENTPLEQEIALDPELLGKVFENLLASYNDDTRTLARKKLGAFYTPRDIVQYMVDEALIGHFITAAPEEKLRSLLSIREGNPCSETETEALIAAIEKTRILDPACGSGAFPMGALHRLVFLLAKLDPHNARWKRRQLEAAKRDRERAEGMEDNENREAALANIEVRILDIEKSFDTVQHDLDYARKIYLIENSIFGADIQPIACQIAKLRFFIALLADQKPGMNLRPLPNLETKLVAANTLIPVDKVKGHQLFLGADQVKILRERLRLVRHDYFNARTPEAKQRHREKDAAIRAKLAEELEAQGMANTTARLLASWDPYNQNAHAGFFDPEWMFSLDGQEFSGFDIVIGNPPYVRQEKIKEDKAALKKLYDCFTGASDLYVYFYERGIQVLKHGGVFSFITSNKWLRSGYGEKLRKYLRKNTRVLRLIDFGDAEIFDAIAYPCIVILEKGHTSEDSTFFALNWRPEWRVEDVPLHLEADMFPMSQADLAPEAWRLESKAKLKLLRQIEAAGTPLGNYVNGRLYYGIKTGLNDAFVVPGEIRDALIAEHPSSNEILKPFLRGRDIKRWHAEFDDSYLIRIESSDNVRHPWSDQPDAKAEQIFAATYPAIHAFMNKKPLRKQMIDRSDQGKYFWELRACAYWQVFQQPKIIYPDIYEHQSFAWDAHGFYCANTCYFIPTDERWLVGLFNSAVVEWFYSQISNKIRGGYMRSFSDYIEKIPVPPATADRRHSMERLCDAIIYLQGRGTAAAYFERLLNAMAYELFFEKELHTEELHFFDLVAAARLPQPGPKADLAGFQEEISDANHPIYAALFALNGLELVRVIEGRE